MAHQGNDKIFELNSLFYQAKQSRWMLGAAAIALVAGCTPSEDSVPFSIVKISPGALSSFFVASWTPALEAAASNLRNSDSRYTIQTQAWTDGSKTYNSNYLDNSDTEYAHAAGLTGAGQIISIIDDGFLQTHEQLDSKTIYLPGGGSNPGVADHGTTVAAVAAGDGSSTTIGVAPGANLALGTFTSNAAMTAAVQQAEALGAIVQNNSWGIATGSGDVTYTASNYNTYFGSGSGAAYINALKSYANNGIIVFAASNEAGRTKSDLMAALPKSVPQIKNSFITVVNAVPNTYAGHHITSAQLASSGCLQAAAWCMAADGGIGHAATSGGNTSYNGGITAGTSFAAPQVSGAIALLAEAFPTLTANDLRARILASADNGFYRHSGYVKFGTVKHGYNNKYGHGFLDLHAALLPIGGSYIPLKNGAAVPMSGPAILGGGMVGDSMTRALSGIDMIYVDGLGGEFGGDAADTLVANAVPSLDPNNALADLMLVNLDSADINPFEVSSAFSNFVPGQELEIALADANIAILLPEQNSGSGNIGLTLSRNFDLADSTLELGLTTLRETDGVAGVRSLVDGDNMGAVHGAATFDWRMPVAKGQEFGISGTLGVANPTDSHAAAQMSDVRYNSLKLTYGARGVWDRNDRLALGVGLPQAVHSGSASFAIPTAQSAGTTSFTDLDVPLTPDGRQVDLSISYGLPLTSQSEVVMTAIHSLNAGNISGETVSSAAIGWKYQF